MGDQHGSRTPERRLGWEAVVCSTALVVYFVLRPPMISNGVPFLLDQPVREFVRDIVLLAAAFGFGIAAARRRARYGRIAGFVCALVSGALLLDWFHLLLNWRDRPWG